MRPIPKKRHEAQETPGEEAREHRTGKEAHPNSPLARSMKRHKRKASRGRKRR